MKTKYVYFIQESSMGAIKIGFSSNVKTRKNSINVCNPSQLNLLCKIAGSSYEESLLHKKFKSFKIKGEWYKPEPELLQFIEKLNKENSFPSNLFEICNSISEEIGSEWIEAVDRFNEKSGYFNIDAAAKILDVSTQTLRNWEENGRVNPIYTSKGHRRYKKAEIFNIHKATNLMNKEFSIKEITGNYLLAELQKLLKSFKPDEKINLHINQNNNVINITLESSNFSLTKMFIMDGKYEKI